MGESTLSFTRPLDEEAWFAAFVAECIKKRLGDDMVFYVRTGSERLPVDERVFVKRFKADAPEFLVKHKNVDWRSTFYLNLFVNNFKYMMEMKIYMVEEAAPTKRKYTTLHKRVHPIYAAPNRVNVMHGTKEIPEVENTYPNIYFTIHDHDLVAEDNPPLSGPGEYVSVCLTAEGPYFGAFLERVELFRGYASFSAVFDAYCAKSSAQNGGGGGGAVSFVTRALLGAPKSGRRSSDGISNGGDGDGSAYQYLTLRGPDGKGRAQMSVAKEAFVRHKSACTNGGDGDDEMLAEAPLGAGAGERGGFLSNIVSVFRSSSSSSASAAATMPSPQKVEMSQRRVSQQPLRCSLTYAMLPWEAIVADVETAWARRAIGANGNGNANANVSTNANVISNASASAGTAHGHAHTHSRTHGHAHAGASMK